VLFTCILNKWYWKVIPLLFPPVVQSIFAKANILLLDNAWKLIFTIFIYEIFIAVFILLEKYTLKPRLS